MNNRGTFRRALLIAGAMMAAGSAGGIAATPTLSPQALKNVYSVSATLPGGVFDEARRINGPCRKPRRTGGGYGTHKQNARKTAKVYAKRRASLSARRRR